MLKEITIRTSKPREKSYKIYDEKGLYLLVLPDGKKYWRFDYRFANKRNTISLGVYPEVSLKEAREKRDSLRKLLGEGIDPSEYRKKERLERESRENTFEALAQEWFSMNQHLWKPSHTKTVRYRLQVYILPSLGKRPVSEITPSEILQLLKRIEMQGNIETAKRVKQICSGVFRYAIVKGKAERDPTQDLRGLIAPSKPKHFPTILDPAKIGKLLRDIDNYQGSFITKCALQLLPLLFVRPGELRHARWSEINFNEAVWDIPAERMKMGRAHRVYLSEQALEILKKLHQVTGHREFLFPGRIPSKPISEGTLNKALQILGYDTKNEITGHGFRAMARTLLHEKLRYPPEIIEHQLAHAAPGPLGEAYNRTMFSEERKKMMQDWANYLNELKTSSLNLP